jgi:hypothetical protein
MTLATNEFIRRFLIHVLPKGFHRIRHYGLFANSSRVDRDVEAALAVLRLRNSSAFVPCWTGMSAGRTTVACQLN